MRHITADDFCDPEQAVAAARKLVSEGVILVVGHMLTELGRANVFRVMLRDDAVGIVAGNYLAGHWPGKKIAILHCQTDGCA